MTTLASGVGYVDLDFLGIPEIIATAVIEGSAGVALIDPGPSTTLENLRAALDRKGIAVKDVRQVLITHIHLDHAGAVGTLVRENPAIEVFVHERGARHMIDPAKLLSSAERLYGPDMDRLWGEFLPVPEGRIRALQGEERVTVAGRDLEVAYTPGHASHHVSYFDPSSRVAFVGDTAGIRRGARLCVMPPTPPPDIDLEAWQISEDRILAWDPDALFLTHFGPFHGARLHFTDLADRLALWSRVVRRLIADTTLDDAGRGQAFVSEAMLELRRNVGEVEAEKYSRAGRLDYSWQGLARYWTKRIAA
ncbi:MAG: MBL fold metallo-hydrolase [Acidobacteriota bacterium]|nr:MBL fold metallo-hydrolase [Acidobacteriota bacterium]